MSAAYRLRNRSSNFFVFYLLPLTLLGLITLAARPQAPGSSREEQSLTREVYHQLELLPRLTVFDNIGFSVSGTTVTLTGQVTQPVKKSDAESTIKGVEGVSNIQNNIQVLPLSPDDEHLRQAEFRAIYSFPSLQKYAWYSVQSIHIIVENRHVTLEGVVDSQADKDAAGVRANSVPGVFSVTNNLQVGQTGAKPQ